MSEITVGSELIHKSSGVKVEVIKRKKDLYLLEMKFIGVQSWHTKAELLNRYDVLNSDVAVESDDTPKAAQILNEAVAIMAERGKSYDKSGGQAERSMPKIVAMFNALTGHELTPEQGWKFMCCLKLARSEQGEYREDNYLDGAAYMALAGEEAEASNE